MYIPKAKCRPHTASLKLSVRTRDVFGLQHQSFRQFSPVIPGQRRVRNGHGYGVKGDHWRCKVSEGRASAEGSKMQGDVDKRESTVLRKTFEEYPEPQAKAQMEDPTVGRVDLRMKLESRREEKRTSVVRYHSARPLPEEIAPPLLQKLEVGAPFTHGTQQHETQWPTKGESISNEAFDNGLGYPPLDKNARQIPLEVKAKGRRDEEPREFARYHALQQPLTLRKIEVDVLNSFAIQRRVNLNGGHNIGNEAPPVDLNHLPRTHLLHLEKAIETPLSPPSYQTTIFDSQIYSGTITSLTPSILRELAIERDVPFLVRSPTSSTTSLEDLAHSSGLPAISKWFHPPPSPSLTHAAQEYHPPFKSYLSNSSHRDVFLPYELLTPILPTSNNGRHDILSSLFWPSHATLSPQLSSPGTLRSILEKCLDHLARSQPPLQSQNDICYEAIAIDARLRAEFLETQEGRPLSSAQWTTLRRYGKLFQSFRAFQAPLGLIMEAATPMEDSESAAASLPGLYIAQAQLGDLPQELQDDLPLPRVLQEFYKDIHPKKIAADIYGANLWMGTPPTFTPLHKDPNPNFFVQLRGQKVMKILPPYSGQALFARVQRNIAATTGGASAIHGGGIRGEEMMQGMERAELEQAVWVEQTKEGENVGEGDMVVLNPGDALYIPKGWWHSVKSVGEGLNASVNWWFR